LVIQDLFIQNIVVLVTKRRSASHHVENENCERNENDKERESLNKNKQK
jgi:hypothetical protein